MSPHVAVTIGMPREEVERRWRAQQRDTDARVSFKDAPGDRGTEVHADVDGPRGGVVGEAVTKLVGTDPVATTHDELRRFKQVLETGDVVRSDGAPGGEHVATEPKQRPAQPVGEAS